MPEPDVGSEAEADQYPGTEERNPRSVVRVTYKDLARGTLTRYLRPGEEMDQPADRVEVEALEPAREEWECQFCGDAHDSLDEHKEHVERFHYAELKREARSNE